MYKKYTIILLIFLFSFLFLGADENESEYLLDGIDGPYIFTQDSTMLVYEIDENNTLNSHKALRSDTFKVVVPNETHDIFYFTLQDSLKIYPACYPESNKIFAVSDIEGNFNALVSLLRGNGIIDENYNWSFGNGHLVINGDLVDRGEFVTQVIWLIYKLEQQAQAQNGMVHFILGNHEIMDIKGRTDYVQDKYIATAQMISKEDNPKKALRNLFSEDSELGAWLRTKNSIELIGNIVFVHAGLSPELLEYNFSFQQINDSIRAYLGWQTGDIENDRARFLFSRYGPVWFRGMVMNYKDYYKKNTDGQVDSILTNYQANTVVIGHTIVDSVSSDYNGKVIRIDIHQPSEKKTGNAQALLIENNIYYCVNDLGLKEKLK
ncbi:MAG: metallophosphoesterase [Candidatus Celaenobacter antarcticus]|nr:metallophosphoesterase [Candidatus Celaenobacter antarcticus]